VLMFIATVVLYLARRSYVMVPVAPSNPSSFMRVVKTALLSPGRGRVGFYLAVTGVVVAIASFGLRVAGWLELVPVLALAIVALIAFGGAGTYLQLDRARGKHSDDAVNGVRAVLSVLIVFALVTPFHSLFDQKASTWVLQGGEMNVPVWEINLWILGTWETTFQPAQMQAFNPLLVMLLIPFNNFVVYPWLRRRGYEPTSLRRMTWGIVFAGVAWLIAGAIQLVIDDGYASTNILWQNGKLILDVVDPPDKLNILWQILPYVFLTFGEVLVSATGLEFAYSQAPLAMKGVIMSFWNLTTTIGNLWVLLVNAGVRNESVTSSIAQTGLTETAFLMFFFAGFALLVAFVFKLYVRRYSLLENYRAVEPPPAVPEARDVSRRD
jgi:proton-dependent oligopeptide transporter, POT family